MTLRVIGESWALERIGFDYTRIDDFLNSKLTGALSNPRLRHPMRAGILTLASRRFDVVAVVHSNPLSKYLILFFGILGIKKLVLFETIIRRATHESSWKTDLLGWLLRRSCRGMQVMVDSDVALYKKVFLLQSHVTKFIPWPMITEDHYSDQEVAPLDKRHHVLSSGRANCDWSTLLEAARDQGWPLIIVCSAEDLTIVKEQAEGINATVLSEISRGEHERLVKTARLYILCLKQAHISSGQIRLSHCSEFRTPLVASDVYGLRGYLKDGVTGIAVQPSNPLALRETVNSLLQDETRLREIVSSSVAFGKGKTITRYAHALAHLVDEGWPSTGNHSNTQREDDAA